MNSAIENFLSAFMYEDDRVGERVALRNHYKRLFGKLIPKYFVPIDDDDDDNAVPPSCGDPSSAAPTQSTEVESLVQS